jgi:hypothetical protein
MTDLDSPEELFKQEQTIFQVIFAKLAPSELIQEEHKQAMAYRLAEIFVASRVMYTKVMPRFMEAETDDEIFEALGEARMNVLNVKDLAEDFEESFLHSISDREGDTDEDSLPEN